MGNCCLGAGCSAAVVPEVFYNCADVAITGSSGPSPPGPVPPGPVPPPVPPPGCRDTNAACPGWVGQCAVPGVATQCPCMCGLRSAAATTASAPGARKRSNRRQRMGNKVMTDGAGTAAVNDATVAGPIADPLPEEVAAAAAAPAEVPANLPAEAYGVVLDEAVPVDFASHQPAVEATQQTDNVDSSSPQTETAP